MYQFGRISAESEEFLFFVLVVFLLGGGQRVECVNQHAVNIFVVRLCEDLVGFPDIGANQVVAYPNVIKALRFPVENLLDMGDGIAIDFFKPDIMDASEAIQQEIVYGNFCFLLFAVVANENLKPCLIQQFLGVEQVFFDILPVVICWNYKGYLQFFFCRSAVARFWENRTRSSSDIPEKISSISVWDRCSFPE